MEDMEDKNGNRELLVDKSLCYLAVHVDATIAKEGPPAAHVLAVCKVYLHHYAVLCVGSRAIEHLALRTNNH